MTHLPPVGLGTMGLTGTDGIEAVVTGLDLGYRHLDTARVYGNEAEVGAALRRSPVDRDDVTVATKVWRTGWAGTPCRTRLESGPPRSASTRSTSSTSTGRSRPTCPRKRWPRWTNSSTTG
jgi:aryl-alcohol dehydrogenase-like predicted oxidoreductase